MAICRRKVKITNVKVVLDDAEGRGPQFEPRPPCAEVTRIIQVSGIVIVTVSKTNIHSNKGNRWLCANLVWALENGRRRPMFAYVGNRHYKQRIWNPSAAKWTSKATTTFGQNWRIWLFNVSKFERACWSLTNNSILEIYLVFSLHDIWIDLNWKSAAIGFGFKHLPLIY